MKINELAVNELISNFENVKNRIIERLATKNVCEKSPKDRILKPIKNTNLKMEYAIDVSDFVEDDDADNDVGAYLLITKPIVDEWGVTESDISELAKFNTPRLLPSNIQSMGNILGNGCLDFPMIIVTNNKISRGAGAIFYKSTIVKVKELLGSDFYIIPSSTHEMICVGKNEALEPEYLLEMVTSINDSDVVMDDDILDYDIYEFVKGKLMSVFRKEK